MSNSRPSARASRTSSHRILLWSLITSRKDSRILKWKVGVRSFLLECHFSPVLVRRPVSSHGHRNL